MSETPEGFLNYFRQNYPGPNTVICSPDWHAPRIYRAALHFSGKDNRIAELERDLAGMEGSLDTLKEALAEKDQLLSIAQAEIDYLKRNYGACLEREKNLLNSKVAK